MNLLSGRQEYVNPSNFGPLLGDYQENENHSKQELVPIFFPTSHYSRVINGFEGRPLTQKEY